MGSTADMTPDGLPQGQPPSGEAKSSVPARLRVTWRVAWPLCFWYLGYAVLIAIVEPFGPCRGDEDLNLVFRSARSFGTMGSLLLVSLIVSRRYRRLVARPVSKTIKVCLYFLLALGALLTFFAAVGLAFSVAAHLEIGY